MGFQPSIVVVTRQTRMQGLLRRHVTARQAKFWLGQAWRHEQRRREETARAGTLAPEQDAGEADFNEYQSEHDSYQQAIDYLERELAFGINVKFVDREFLPTYDFWDCCLVVVVGQDGLVANTAKYVGELPILAVNPDPRRIDGVLLPFQLSQARQAARSVLDRTARMRGVSLARAELSDGQRLLAFNDFFLGQASHVSSRYLLQVGGQSEAQSSSGILVSTGAGSTGWLSSVFNMARGLAKWRSAPPCDRVQLEWEDRRLVWAVREPFISRHSRASLVAGFLDEGQELVVESLMPEAGVIFSDGIGADFLKFTSGVTARISCAPTQARLVVPG